MICLDAPRPAPQYRIKTLMHTINDRLESELKTALYALRMMTWLL